MALCSLLSGDDRVDTTSFYIPDIPHKQGGICLSNLIVLLFTCSYIKYVFLSPVDLTIFSNVHSLSKYPDTSARNVFPEISLSNPVQ